MPHQPRRRQRNQTLIVDIMEMKQPELTLEESISQVMHTLPPVIRDYLAQGKHTQVVRDLVAKHDLRIDQAGVLEREVMLLLMGIEKPEEFIQALSDDARLGKDVVTRLAQDVNEKIFVPLRKQEEADGMGDAEKAEIAAPPSVAASVPETEMVAPTVAPVAPPPAPPRSIGSAMAGAPLLPRTILPGSMPRVELPGPGQALKSLSGAPAEVPKVGLPQTTVPPVTSPRPPAQPIRPVAPQVSPHIALAPYATDPYREPIEGEPGA